MKPSTPDKPLHIALVTETYLPEVNGVAITIGRMVQGLRERGHSIHLIRPRQHDQDVAVDAFNYRETLVAGFSIPGYAGLKSGLPAGTRLKKLWSEQRPDIVHIATEGPLGWSALNAAHKLGIPVCTDFHTNFHSYTSHYGIGLLKWPISTYLRNFHNKAACTLVPTLQLQHQLEQDGYQRVQVVSRGVDTTLFSPSHRDQALRSSWGAGASDIVVVLVSRMAAEKNLSLAISAFEQMQNIRPGSKMVMVGDGPLREQLQKQHPDILFAGVQTGEALATHYASGDIFLYPSMTETYGNVTVEAMASGLAVVAYDYAAARQHIQQHENGVLSTFGDEAAFVADATSLIADLPHIASMKLAACASMQNLSWDHIMGQMESVLLATVRTQGVAHAQAEFVPAAN